MTTATLKASLAAVATGDADIASARGAVRAAIKAGTGMVDAAYAALREATFRIVSSREHDADLPLWFDLATHAGTLARGADRPDLAEKIFGFSELIAQTGRFADRQPLGEVLARKHVAGLIAAIADHDGDAVPRAVIADQVGLADANLSRLLGILCTHGLIRRLREGKEARLQLTEAGRVAAAKLGHPTIAGACGAPGDWWRALSWPMILWAADGAPLGGNEASRYLVEEIGGPVPGALDHDAWSQALSAVSQEIRHTGDSRSRDHRFADNSWVRVIEDRLAGGERLVMLIDLSVTLGAQQTLERRLRKSDEQIAELRSRLAESEARFAELRAKLEDTERRLLSFTSWIAAMKANVVDETVSLATRLRRWTDRLKPGPLRAEAELADQQIVGLKRAVQTLLYTSNWHTEALEPEQAVSPANLISDSIDVVRTFADSDIALELDFAKSLQVCAHVPVMQAAIGQGILHLVNEKPEARYFVKSAIEGDVLNVLCVGTMKAKPGKIRDDLGWYMRHSAGSIGQPPGFGHARDVAEIIGGTMQVAKDQSYVIMALPITAPSHARRRRTVALED